jgi:PIN domain nuclease of toxin-antitoxin system
LSRYQKKSYRHGDYEVSAGYAHIVENYEAVFLELGAIELPVSTKHALYAGKLEWGHRDPFDRILAAQALVDNLTLISNDSVFHTLASMKVLW